MKRFVDYIKESLLDNEENVIDKNLFPDIDRSEWNHYVTLEVPPHEGIPFLRIYNVIIPFTIDNKTIGISHSFIKENESFKNYITVKIFNGTENAAQKLFNKTPDESFIITLENITDDVIRIKQISKDILYSITNNSYKIKYKFNILKKLYKHNKILSWRDFIDMMNSCYESLLDDEENIVNNDAVKTNFINKIFDLSKFDNNWILLQNSFLRDKHTYIIHNGKKIDLSGILRKFYWDNIFIAFIDSNVKVEGRYILLIKENTVIAIRENTHYEHVLGLTHYYYNRCYGFTQFIEKADKMFRLPADKWGWLWDEFINKCDEMNISKSDKIFSI